MMALSFNSFLITFIALTVGFDLQQGRIPNWLILVGVLGGIAVNTMKGLDQLLYSLFGLGLGVGILILPFALGWLGAGDVKLLGAVGSILGVSWMPRVFFYSALAGGLLALYVVCFRARGGLAFGRLWLDLKLFLVSRGGVAPGPAIGTRSCVPLGVAIGLGTLIAFYLDPGGRWAGF